MENRIATLMSDWSAWVAVAVVLYGITVGVCVGRKLPKQTQAPSSTPGSRLCILMILLAVAVLGVSIYLLRHGMEQAGEQVVACWLGLVVAGIVAMLDSWLGRLQAAGKGRALASARLLAPAFALLPIAHMIDGFREAPLEISLSFLIGAALVAVLVRGTRVAAKSSGSAGVETYVLLAAGIIAAEALARYRFPKEVAAQVFAYGIAAVSLVAAMIGVWLAPIRDGRARPAIPTILVMLIVGGAGYLIAVRVMHQPGASFCVGIGLISTAILWWAMTQRATGAITGACGASLGAVMIAGAILLPFRLLGGYGIGLSAVGMLALIPLILCLVTTQDEKQDSPTRAATLGAGIVLAAAFLRVLIESHAVRATITIDALYPLVGLMIGGSLPMLLRSITTDAAERSSSAIFAAVKMAFWAMAAPLLIALFLGSTSVGGFLAGMVAGELFALLLLYVTDAELAGVASLTVLMTAAAIRLGPFLGDWSAELRRGEKVHYLAWMAGAAVAWVIVTAIARAARAPKAS